MFIGKISIKEYVKLTQKHPEAFDSLARRLILLYRPSKSDLANDGKKVERYYVDPEYPFSDQWKYAKYQVFDKIYDRDEDLKMTGCLKLFRVNSKGKRIKSRSEYRNGVHICATSEGWRITKGDTLEVKSNSKKNGKQEKSTFPKTWGQLMKRYSKSKNPTTTGTSDSLLDDSSEGSSTDSSSSSSKSSSRSSLTGSTSSFEYRPSYVELHAQIYPLSDVNEIGEMIDENRQLYEEVYNFRLSPKKAKDKQDLSTSKIPPKVLIVDLCCMHITFK